MPDARFARVGDVAHPLHSGYRDELGVSPLPPLARRVSFWDIAGTFRMSRPSRLLRALEPARGIRQRADRGHGGRVPIVATDVDNASASDGTAHELVSADPLAFAEAVMRVVTDPARSFHDCAGKAVRRRASSRAARTGHRAVFTQAVS